MKSYAHQKGITWLEVIILLLVIFVLVGLFIPHGFLRAAKAGARTEALNNAKAIAGGLVAFKNDKGAYPCAFTRTALEKEGFSHLPNGTDANAYFAQLIVTDIIDDEGVFNAAKSGSRKGDNIKDTSTTLLSPGENGFAYIMAPNEKPLTDVTSNTPLVLAPIREAGKVPTFDPEAYKGKGVYGAVDGSGKVFMIDENGHASSKGRRDFFANGPDSLFGNDVPIIKLPSGLEFPSPSHGNWWFALLLLPFIGGLWWLASGARKTAVKVPE
jgi:hypothetical protein